MKKPVFKPEFVRHGDTETAWETTIARTGRVTFTVDRDVLDRSVSGGEPRLLSPDILIGFSLSVFRLMAAVLGAFSDQRERKVVGGFAIGQSRGWRLRPRSPREPLPPWKQPAMIIEEDLFTFTPITIPADELKDRPGRSAVRLIRQVYLAFGFEDEDIPREFDLETGELRLG